MVESPWDQVPLDVVSEILLWTCNMPPPLSSSCPSGNLTSSSTKGILSPGAMQWSLCCVCRAWRTLVLSYPALWSELQVHIHWGLGHRYVFALELALARSSNHVLDVEIIDHDCDGDEVSKPVESCSTQHEIIMRLFAESHRWRSAELNFRGRAVAQIVNLLQGRLPRLESLVLGAGCPYEIATMRAFADCPSLRTVDIPIPCTPDIQWNQIISYRCTSQVRTSPGYWWSLNSCLSNVGACQVLESFSLLLETSFEPHSRVIVTNRSLRRLEVACAIILDHLILPELTDVKLVRICAKDETRGSPGLMDGVFESLEKLLLRSDGAHKITRLTLVDVSITSDAFVSAIARTENLEVLHVDATRPEAIKRGSFDDGNDRIKVNHNKNTLEKFFANLDNREKIWLPRLRVFSLSIIHDRAFPFFTSNVELVRLLQFRWKGSTEPAMVKLHNFRLVQYRKNSWNPSTSIRKDLQALVDDGMTLTVQVSTEADGIIVGSYSGHCSLF